MSTQLILYPQTYDGTTSLASQYGLEFVTDGIIFNSINTSTSYETGYSINAHMALTTPSVVNTWFRWRRTTGSPPAYPTETGGNVFLNSIAYSWSGVYQKLDNLTVGASYTLTVVTSIVSTPGTLTLQRFNSSGGGGISLSFGPTLSGTYTYDFTASTTNDIIFVQYYNATASDLKIFNISVSPTVTAPSQIYDDLEDGQVICDLYQEEDIPLTLSVDDFKNVAEKVQSYSKDFNLPATKRNNQIFNNMFDVTRTDDGLIFNPYAKTKCVLKQDGFVLFEGSLRLIDVKDKEGEISYSVNLYSQVIALADILKDATFSDLDFSELDHTYNFSTIRDSWQGDLPLENPLTDPNEFAGPVGATVTNVLRYPFIDWTGQIGLDPFYSFPKLANLEQAFRPTIRIKYIIDKIFAAAGFTYTSDFFNTTILGGGSFNFFMLYMDFNWGGAAMNNSEVVGSARKTPASGTNYALNGTYSTVEFPLVSSVDFWATEAGFDPSTSIFTAPVSGVTLRVGYKIPLRWSIGTPATVTIRWVSSVDGVMDEVTHYQSGAVGLFHYDGFVQTTLGLGDTLHCEFKADVGSAVFQYDTSAAHNQSMNYGTVSTAKVTTGTLLNTLRGELGQWEFLKGFFTMFNLVTMVDENNPNNLLIEPYSDVFINNTNSGTTGDLTLASRGVEHDWTDKVDVSQMDLKPLTDLNKDTIFKFAEDDSDFAFNVYQRTTGKLYGSKEFDASSVIVSAAQSTLLDGKKEIIAEPFAATVSKPLYEQFPDFIVPCVYARNDDGSFEAFDNSPRIFYLNYYDPNTYQTLTSCTYGVPTQNDVAGDDYEEDFLQFSHLTDIPTQTGTIDFYFGSDGYIQPIGAMAVDNLYSLYWQPYFNELYNPDTRTMTLKVNLTPADINTFKFYDVVFIKNRTFRVNRIDYKPNDLATVEFILIP
jgi:hypothetical protein